MTASIGDYRATQLEERKGGWISTDDLNARFLLEENRRAYGATGNALFAWSALAVLLRPGARPEEQYREPIIAPDPAPPLPAWLAAYLNATARAVLAPLLELSPATAGTAAGLSWCRRELEETGELLALWAGVLLLRPAEGAELPAWIAAALFRSARDLSDHMAGRDLARRPPASLGEELARWQATERAPRAAAPELLAALGFPLPPAPRARLARQVAAFARVHARMKAAPDFPIGFRLSQMPARVSAFDVLCAFGFPKRKGANPFLEVQECLRSNDAAFTYDLLVAHRRPPAAAIKAAAVAVNDHANIYRRIQRARRLAAPPPEPGA